jgi:two-component system, OmpR family, sensor histidine kinase KdpD
MSRLNSGKLSLKRDWHEVGDLISVVLDSQKTTLSGHEVVMRIAENLPLVRVDFQLFQQVLSNLLLNVATYTAPGTTVEIEARATGSSLQLTVSDNGPGLPEASIPHLFEMFYRVPGSPSGGAGIGLSITKGIVEVHGGTVIVSNCPSGGTCFTITLPIEQQPQMPQDKDSL